MRKKIFLLFAFSSLLISGVPLALAQEGDQVGSVIAIRGKVTAFDTRGVTRELSIKSPVFRRDTLRTGPQGRVQVLFSDNTIVSLGKESRMEIIEHIWNPDRKTGTMKTKVKEGVFRVMGGAIAKDSPETFTTETPAATIGIRGSMYAGRVEKGTLSVVFEGGKGIYVVNDTGEMSITRPGFGTRIQGQDTLPEKPARVSTQDVSGINNDLSVDGQTEEDEAAAPAQGGDGGSTTQDQTGVSSSGSEGESGSITSHAEQQSGTGDQSSGGSEQTASDAGAGTGDQTQPVQGGDAETGLSTFVAAGTTQPGDTSSAASGLEGQFTISEPFFEPTPIPSSTNPVSTVTGSDTLSQDRLATTVQDLASIPGIAMSGASMSGLADIDNYWNTNNNLSYSESLTATSTAGLVACTLTAPGGTAYNFSFSISPRNPGGTYAPTGIQTYSLPYTINLLGSDRTFTWKIISDPLGEFAFYNTLSSFTQTATYEFAELGYVGAPSASTLRGNGIDLYQGPALGFESIGPDPGTARKDFGAGDMGMEVNWLNGKVLGLIDFSNTGTSDPGSDYSDSLLFFFGDIDRTNGTLTNVRFLGSRGPEEKDPTGPVAWIEGSIFSGRFYGSDNQGFGIMGIGNDFDVSSNMTSRVGTSRLDGAALRAAQDPLSATSPTGIVSLSGFVVGVAEQMSNPMNRRIFMNTNPTGFLLGINRDLGILSGSLSADDILNANVHLLNIEIGSSHGSAYVLDDAFAAVLGDTGNDAVSVYALSGGLKPYANFLVTANPSDQLNDYVSWGYWEIAYNDPGILESYHVHQPGAFWVAGEKTNPTVIQNMIATDFIGTYAGGAHGVSINNLGVMNPLTNGVTSLTFDFNPAASNPVSGSINFTECTIGLTNGSIDGALSGFSADIVAGSAGDGAFGAFYGPNAEAIGGNFNAGIGGTRYLGIFEGKR